MRAPFLLAVLLLPPAMVVAAALVLRGHVALELPPPLDDEARAAAVAVFRSRVLARPDHPQLERPLAGPAIASVWSRGERVKRVEGRGPTAADALVDAARQLGKVAPAARVQLDLVVAVGPIAEDGVARTFGLVPGLDGLGMAVDGKEILVGADELAQGRVLLARRPFPVMDFNAGLDASRADWLLGRRAGLRAAELARAGRRSFRFRADSFIERPRVDRGRPPLRLVRGLPDGPPVTRATLREGALAAARFLARHLADNGRFIYELDLATGRGSDPTDLARYSLPRHAGSTYFLAQVYATTRAPELLPPLERALRTLVELAHAGGCAGTTEMGEPYLCVVDRGAGVARLGSTALAVVALAEHRLATGDARHDETHRRLVAFLLDQQKPGGEFVHLFDVNARRKDLETRLLYFDGEAALALARSHAVLGDPRALAATERALDNLVGFYDFFAGQFVFNEEHWTCIAAEAAWPHLRHDRYREFCSDYGAFLRRMIFEPEDGPDVAGGYGVTPFFVPGNTPTASRTEAMISAYLLTRHHGRPDERIRAQVLGAVGYLLRQQLREDNAFWSRAAFPLGAIPASAIDPTVRIDFLQHAGSAMLRASELAEAE